MVKRTKISPFTPMMPKRVRKEVQAQKGMSSVSIARRKVTTSQSVGLQEAEKRVKDLIKREKERPRQKKLPERQKRKKKMKRQKRKLRKHGWQ